MGLCETRRHTTSLDDIGLKRSPFPGQREKCRINFAQRLVGSFQNCQSRQNWLSGYREIVSCECDVNIRQYRQINVIWSRPEVAADVTSFLLMI